MLGNRGIRSAFVMLSMLVTSVSCAPVDIPENGSVSVSATKRPTEKFEGINENQNPITRVKLGTDMLVPQIIDEDEFPKEQVGPYELRGETLANALQMILDDYDVSVAFESNAAFERKITVANLRGDLGAVVDRVCALADLYCHFDHGNLTVKESETFVVDLPPIGNISASDDGKSTTTDAYAQISTGLKAIIGSEPAVDSATRTMIYNATQRTNKAAKQYFERLRKNTALIVFDTHIWEVTLDNANRTGISWDTLFKKTGGNWTSELKATNSVSSDYSPVSISPGYTGSGSFSADAVFQFISSRGAVKTVSQPQIAMLSGTKATLTVTEEENFVSGVTRSTDSNGNDSVSTTTETVQTGLTLKIKSAWDQSTVYGGLDISLDDLLKMQEFQPDSNTTIQLPQTTKRGLQTEIRVKPGDAILIGGLVSEKDSYQASGPGVSAPLVPTSRAVTKDNTELVFLLRPRVVIFDMGDPARDTSQVVNAPRSGSKVKSMKVSDLTGNVKGLFEEKKNPMQDLTDKVGKMMGVGKVEVKAELIEEELKKNSEKPKAVKTSDEPVAEKAKAPAVTPPELKKTDAKTGEVKPVANTAKTADVKKEEPVKKAVAKKIDENESLSQPVKLYGSPVNNPKELLKQDAKSEKTSDKNVNNSADKEDDEDEASSPAK